MLGTIIGDFVGKIAEAHYGIPEDIRQKELDYLPNVYLPSSINPKSYDTRRTDQSMQILQGGGSPAV